MGERKREPRREKEAEFDHRNTRRRRDEVFILFFRFYFLFLKFFQYSYDRFPGKMVEKDKKDESRFLS